MTNEERWGGMSDPASIFKTDRLDAACYLLASDSLRMIGIEAVNPTKVAFIFADPDQRGEEFILDFDRGAQCSASALFASQRFLRTQMSKYISRNKPIGVSHDRSTATR